MGEGVAAGTLKITPSKDIKLASASGGLLTFTTPDPSSSGKSETAVGPTASGGTCLKTETVTPFTLHDFNVSISGYFTAQVLKSGPQDHTVTMTHTASPITEFSVFRVQILPFQSDGFWKLEVDNATARAFEIHMMASVGGQLSEDLSTQDQAQGSVMRGTLNANYIEIQMRPKGLVEGDVVDVEFTVFLNGKPAPAAGPV
jgi:hypothetical protein